MVTALIIDDMETNIEMLQAYLRLFAIETIAAITGKDGFELAKSHTPDVIFMDLLMPEETWDGYKAIQELRLYRQTSHIPIVVITGAGEEYRSYEMGCDAFIVRPFQKHHLGNVLDTLQLIEMANGGAK